MNLSCMPFYFRALIFSLSFLLPALCPGQIFVGKGAALVVTEGTVISEKPADTLKPQKNAGKIYIAGNALIHNSEGISNAEFVYIEPDSKNRTLSKKIPKKAVASAKKPEKRPQRIVQAPATQHLLANNSSEYISAEKQSAPAAPVPTSLFKGILADRPESCPVPEIPQAASLTYTEGFACYSYISCFQIRPPPALSFSA